MSGHSKWHNIQGRKGKQDKIRGNIFTKMGKLISVAARQGGGDINSNFSLRLAIEKAKEANMPKDNIDRAIKRGTGELKDAAILEEVVYEAFGPGGIAVIIEAVTDNKNRTGPEIKNILSKSGANVAGQGSVQWQFSRKGVIRFTLDKKNNIKNWEDTQLNLIDSGAEEINESAEGVEILLPIENLQRVLEKLKNINVDPDDSGLEWVPKETVEVDENTKNKIENLYNILEEQDDVRGVYTNEA